MIDKIKNNNGRIKRVVFKRICLALFMSFLLMGCSTNVSKYSNSFTSFDTYIEFMAYTNNKNDFDKFFNKTKEQFTYYHHLFDAYNNYKDLNNIKTINDNAGIKKIVVDKELFDVIRQTKAYYKQTYQMNNIALAPIIIEYKSVQEAYDAGKKVTNPDINRLKELAKCTSIDNIVLNEADHSIYLKEKCSKIDVGAIAKGYTTNKVAQLLKKDGLNSGIINAGGNVVIVGNKGGSDFSIGIADPNNPQSYKVMLKSQDNNIVTSGDYQRYYMVDGQRMNHIINPKTLLPANKHRSLTIITKDGLLADYLSTECFMLDIKEINELRKKFDFEYIVINKDNKVIASEGIKNAIEIK